ncbi:right-handed parallel beta-helix repeat-containing protein [Actinoplanes subtropicus]|uniref:right-handed parallel beta-helix repeat-containing protein n=1 Tax=Actinoplanes subtropicus TaxID=543632 RepID=UPI00068AAB3D|nr:right-handed parallel beta-helix repeat-containing protein [Actinoplanes subtropicus]
MSTVRRVAAVAVVATVILGLSASAAQAHRRTTLFVSPHGSDSAAGTLAAPMRTPQAAVERLGRAGGTVRLARGTYGRQRIVIDGRAHVAILGSPGAVLDGTGLKPPAGRSGMVEIRDSSDVSVSGLGIAGYRTKALSAVPIGIFVTGSGHGIRLAGNHVHHLGNDNGTLGSFDINAHGIAVYGTDARAAIADVRISGNELDHLVLGASETLVLNGNVDGWSVTGNVIHDDNNIGIDAIGFEDTISGPARFTGVNRARHGLIAGNRVSRIISEGNPAYWEDGSWCNCADGIYVDGGGSIVIAGNRVDASDIGIEVASEWKQGRTNDIRVSGNTVTGSRYTGLAIGGYDRDRGEAYDIGVFGNWLRGNNTLRDGSPEILLQYYVHDTTISHNTVISTNPGQTVLLHRDAPAGGAAKNARLVLDHNTYQGRAAAGRELYYWNGVERRGLAAYRAASGQDRSSTYRRNR